MYSGGSTGDLIKSYGRRSPDTFYRWRKRYGGLDRSEVRRLEALEQENARLKKILAERDLEIEVMKEIAAKKW